MNWLTKLRERIQGARNVPALDTLLANARPDHSLAERVAWMEDLLAWVRKDAPAARLRLFFQMLDRQHEARKRVAQTLRSLVRDTQALDLFADTGLPRGPAFLHELFSRLVSEILPDPQDTRDLADIFDRLFPHRSDADWLEHLEGDLAERIVRLFHQDEEPSEAGWASLFADVEDALVQLSDRICVGGSRREVRTRLARVNFRELPFQKLPPAIEALLERSRAGAPLSDLSAELNRVRALTDACDRALDEIVGRLEKTGVSTSLVYELDRLRAQINRLEMLLDAWAAPNADARRTLTILADLVRQNHARRSVRELLRQNLQLLTRRIVERNAETGEHYVARSAREYMSMWRSAAGGGLFMGLATFIKLLLGKIAFAGFFKGLAFGVNYAGCFVLVQLCGFTIATKQPATTAPALARRMNELRNSAQLEALVDEVVFLIRSQTAAVLGNLALVIPAAFLFDTFWLALSGHHLADAHKAETLLNSVLPWSGCWFFAMFTGVLLWLSSLLAAWADNWFALHQLSPALAQHRTLHRWIGPSRSRKMAVWLERNIAGLAGNISLGLMLGLIPEIAIFFGLPIDVRHVTLSTGQATVAFAQLGADAFWQVSTLWIALGILGVGALNILVSFSLALFVAIRARGVRGPERTFFFKALGRRLVTSPLSFLLPVGITQTPKTATH